LVIELPFLGRIVTTRYAAELNLRFLSGGLWRPNTVKADRIDAFGRQRDTE